MKIGDGVYVHGYVDEIRKDTVIIRNNGGYFGTVKNEIVVPFAELATNLQQSCNQLATDCISRQAAINAIIAKLDAIDHVPQWVFDELTGAIGDLPSAQPTIYGYNVEHLEMIARVLQKENLPPERVVEMLIDIGRIVAIVCDEFEDNLRKAVEQCMT